MRDSNVASVVEICQRLDGIPLAIELAAARVSAMSPDDIAGRLGDRFRLLAGGRRTAVPRQQTLHAMIDWSWDLLTDEDRRLLRRLSVFSGGWTVPMAARIVGDDSDGMDPLDLEDGLTRLIDRSLVLVDRDTMRYRMLETIRQYARERLIAAGEAPALADRHLAVYAAFATESVEPMRGPRMVDWLDRLDAELDNLGTALEWGLEAEPWTAVGMATALLPYWAVRVMSQDNDARIVAAIEIARARVVDRPDARPEDQALAAKLLGEGSAPVGHVRDVRPSRSAGPRTPCASARRAATPRHVWPPWRASAIALVFSGQRGSGRYGCAADLRGWRGPRRGDRRVVAPRPGGRVLGGQSRRRPTRMAERPSCSAASTRRSGPAVRTRSAPWRWRRVECSGASGKTDAAMAAFGVGIERFLELGDERFVLASRSDMAHALRRGGRLDEALALYRETIGGWVHLGHKGAVANQLENIAYLATERGRTELAVRLLGAAEAIREAADARMAFDEEPEYLASVERLRAALIPAVFEGAWAAGRGLSQVDAVALAARRLTPYDALTQLLDALPIPLVFVAFAIVTLVCYEVGFRLGRWWQERTPGEQEGPTGMLVGSILALLAFLLAVTMGMASDRFDARRALVLAEANAIGTAYLRAGYLPEPASSEARELLREYVPLRIVSSDTTDIQAESISRTRSSRSYGR